MSRNLNKKETTKNKSKLKALFSTLDPSFEKKSKVKEGSIQEKYFKLYKKHFSFLINDKPIKKINFENEVPFKAKDVFHLDDKMTYFLWNKKPFLSLKSVFSNEEDVCFFCLNSFSDLKKHLEEEIKEI